MGVKITNLALFLAFAATLAALLLHDHLPKRRWQLLPNENAHFALYADELEGGPSHSEWVDESERIWRCRVEPEGQFVYCGINILISDNNRDGVDLSGYSQVHLTVTALGDPRPLRLFMRHYDPHYSTPDDGNSAQFIKFRIRPQDLGQPLAIGMNEFTLADWWLAERDVPRRFAKPHFSNIIALGLDYREALPPGNYDVKLEKLEFVGDWVSAENWYLGIIVAWLSGIFVFIGWRLVALSQALALDRGRLQNLASRQRELKRETSKYRELYARDQLTDAYNRRGFEKKLDELTQQPLGGALALILIDIDHFKPVNDLRGHAAGDRVIARFAQIIREHTRGQDVFCRWGGEEFVLLCPNTTPDQAYCLAEKIRQIILDTEFDENQSLRLSASFGVTQLQLDEDFDQAFSRADQALYRAKGAGRNRTELVP